MPQILFYFLMNDHGLKNWNELKSSTKYLKVITIYSTWFLTNLGEKSKWNQSTGLFYPFYLRSITHNLHYAHCVSSQGHLSLTASDPAHPSLPPGMKHFPLFTETLSFIYQRIPYSCSLATGTKTYPHKCQPRSCFLTNPGFRIASK